MLGLSSGPVEIMGVSLWLAEWELCRLLVLQHGSSCPGESNKYHLSSLFFSSDFFLLSERKKMRKCLARKKEKTQKLLLVLLLSSGCIFIQYVFFDTAKKNQDFCLLKTTTIIGSSITRYIFHTCSLDYLSSFY